MAVISLIGTLAGSGGTIVMANRMIAYRVEKLEELVRERSGAIERIYILERDRAVIEEKIRDMDKRLGAVEKRKEV